MARAKGGAPEDGFASPVQVVGQRRHFKTLHPRSGHEDWGLAVDSRLAHRHSFGLFGRTEMSTQLFCGYLKDLFLPVGEDESDTDGNCFSGS